MAVVQYLRRPDKGRNVQVKALPALFYRNPTSFWPLDPHLHVLGPQPSAPGRDLGMRYFKYPADSAADDPSGRDTGPRLTATQAPHRTAPRSNGYDPPETTAGVREILETLRPHPGFRGRAFCVADGGSYRDSTEWRHP